MKSRQVRVCIALQKVEGAGLSSLLRAAKHSGRSLLLFWTGSKGITANEWMPSGICLETLSKGINESQRLRDLNKVAS